MAESGGWDVGRLRKEGEKGWGGELGEKDVRVSERRKKFERNKSTGVGEGD